MCEIECVCEEIASILSEFSLETYRTLISKGAASFLFLGMPMKSRLMSLMLSAPLLCIPFDNYYFDFDSCGSVFLFLNTYVFGNLICLPCLWSLLLCSFNDSKFQREFMLVALIMFQLFGFEEATPGMLTNIACDAYRQPNLEWRYPNF